VSGEERGERREGWQGEGRRERDTRARARAPALGPSTFFSCHPLPPPPPPTSCLINSGRVIPIAITFGFTLFTMVYATASYSGGHLNPAITLGALAAGKVSCLRALTYIGAQLAGGLLGVACVRAIDPTLYAQAGGGANLLSSAVSAGGGLLLEFLLTFALMFVVLAATDTTRYRGVAHLPVLAPLAIGMTVLVAHLAAVPIDGCSLNPARSFATAVMSGTWTSQWLFWAGPILGALVATWVYELGFRPDWDPVMAMDEGGGAGAAVQGAGGGGGGAGPSGGVPKPALYPPGASVV